jgi:hypothetical protein
LADPQRLSTATLTRQSLLEIGEALVVQMAPPQRMLAALKRMGIKTP